MKSTLRVRLTVWFAALAIVAISVASVLAFIAYARVLYRSVDRGLAADAATHVLSGAAVRPGRTPIGVASGQLDTFVRTYDVQSNPVAGPPDLPFPPLSPSEVLAARGRSPLPRYLVWLPVRRVSTTGTFASAQSTDAHRIRLFVLPQYVAGELTGYVETWTSVSDEDANIRRLGLLLLTVDGTLALFMWVGGMRIAGAALYPLRQVIQTTREITTSRDLSRRVPVAGSEDELRALASTLNGMFASLEEAFSSQQRFVADAAHELRAPVTIVLAAAQLLDQQVTEPRERDAILQMRDAATNLARTVDDLLLLARSDARTALSTAPFELDAAVLRVIAATNTRISSPRVRLTAVTPITVSGNGPAIEQSLTILLDNALRYTDGGVQVSIGRSSHEAIVQIIDEGPGMASDLLAHVFERFVRGDDAQRRFPGGSGLGLPIARALIEQQGGTLSLTSDPTRGTTARITVPRCHPYRRTERSVPEATSAAGGEIVSQS